MLPPGFSTLDLGLGIFPPKPALEADPLTREPEADLAEPEPLDPTLKSREELEELSMDGKLKSENVSKLLCVSQLNGAFEPLDQ